MLSDIDIAEEIYQELMFSYIVLVLSHTCLLYVFDGHGNKAIN